MNRSGRHVARSSFDVTQDRRRETGAAPKLVLHRRFGLGALPPVLGLTLTTEHQDLVGRVFGCWSDKFVGNAAAFMQFQQRRIHQAKALLGL